MKFYSRRVALARIIVCVGRYATILEKNNINTKIQIGKGMCMPKDYTSTPNLGRNKDEILIVDCGDRCSLCLREIEDEKIYYRPACGHAFCTPCMEDDPPSRCGNCEKEIRTAEPVRAVQRNQVIEI